jgi:hypothetical protein
MLKRTLALAVSAAFLAATAILVAPVDRAYAEMAAPQSKKQSTTSERKGAADKSGMSGAERRKKCSAEWKETKAAGKAAGRTWPQFYSECNKRLKGG